MIEVVAALLWRGERFLLCRRPFTKARGGQWEFPGGKVEAGESGAQAIVRELREELNITVTAGEECAAVVYAYPELTVSLHLIEAALTGAQPELLEHLEARWVSLTEARALDLCPADRILLEELWNLKRKSP